MCLASPRAVTWRQEMDLSAFLDEQPTTCTTIPFHDVHLQSVPVLVTTEAFKSLKLRLTMQNLSAEPVTKCGLPVFVLTQASELELGQANCKPFCDLLVKCDLVSKLDVDPITNVAAIDYVCHCQVDSCKGVAVHVPRSAVLDPSSTVGLCHVATTVLWLLELHTLQWRHNERGGVSNHRRFDCLLNRLFRHRSKKTPRHWPLWGEFTDDRWIPHTKGQWRGNDSIWWHLHDVSRDEYIILNEIFITFLWRKWPTRLQVVQLYFWNLVHISVVYAVFYLYS